MKTKILNALAGIILWLALVFIALSFDKCNAQKIPSDVKHFYGSFLLSEGIYQTQKLCFKNQDEFNRVLFTYCGSLLISSGKEFIHDLYLKRGVYSKEDLILNFFGASTWLEIRIIINDQKKRKYEKNNFRHFAIN